MVFKILAFGGGGSRGILHTGAIKYFEESGLLANVTDVYGCTDENAINFDSLATLDNGSCAFSIAYLATGDWNITNLEYDTQIEIPVVGTQSFSGEANDAGFWSFQYPENTCSNTLSFAVTIDNPLISAIFDSIPIDINTNGTWELSNNDNTLTITDEQTIRSGEVLVFEIRNYENEYEEAQCLLNINTFNIIKIVAC